MLVRVGKTDRRRALTSLERLPAATRPQFSEIGLDNVRLLTVAGPADIVRRALLALSREVGHLSAVRHDSAVEVLTLNLPGGHQARISTALPLRPGHSESMKADVATPGAATPYAVKVRILGTVTGVGFRSFATKVAKRFDLSGWVRNRSDGTVEALLVGEKARVNDALERLRSGPRRAAVTELRVVEVDIADGTSSSGFRIRKDRVERSALANYPTPRRLLRRLRAYGTTEPATR